MTLKGDAKFKGKLTSGLKNDLRNLVNFHESSWKSGNLHFDGLLLSNVYKYLDEKEQELYVMTLKSDAKFEEKLTLGSKMTWGIWWILMGAVASLQICTFMCYFCQQHIKFQVKKCRRIISHGTEEWSKLWRKLWWATFVESRYVWAKKIYRSCVVKNDLWFQKWHK